MKYDVSIRRIYPEGLLVEAASKEEALKKVREHIGNINKFDHDETPDDIHWADDVLPPYYEVTGEVEEVNEDGV